MTKYRICLIVVLLMSLMLLGTLSGYFFLTPNLGELAAAQEKEELPALNEPVAAAPEEAIGSGTKIVYEYIYMGGHKETNETFAPKNWYGLTLSEFKDIFTSWQIKEFSSDKVVLSKNLKAYSPNHYVLGVHDGYVAVFRKNEYMDKATDKVKQVTETPVGSLPAEEQKRLNAGIDFYGDNELIKILEDYET